MSMRWIHHLFRRLRGSLTGWGAATSRASTSAASNVGSSGRHFVKNSALVLAFCIANVTASAVGMKRSHTCNRFRLAIIAPLF